MSVIAAAVFGIIHDQITARICIEYFTIGHPRLIESESPTILGLFWGIVATWWVGLPLGVGLAVAARAGDRPKIRAVETIRPILILMTVMYGVAFFAGLIGFVTSNLGAFHLNEPLASSIPQNKHVAFLTDAWAHGGSYAAGLVGGMALWFRVWRRRGVHLN